MKSTCIRYASPGSLLSDRLRDAAEARPVSTENPNRPPRRVRPGPCRAGGSGRRRPRRSQVPGHRPAQEGFRSRDQGRPPGRLRQGGASYNAGLAAYGTDNAAAGKAFGDAVAGFSDVIQEAFPCSSPPRRRAPLSLRDTAIKEGERSLPRPPGRLRRRFRQARTPPSHLGRLRDRPCRVQGVRARVRGARQALRRLQRAGFPRVQGPRQMGQLELDFGRGQVCLLPEPLQD